MGRRDPISTEERFIDAAIYRARPDVMAIVHTHAPDLIAFSSVPSRCRPAEGASRSTTCASSTTAGWPRSRRRNSRARSPRLSGRSNAILLLGHGAVVVGNSVRAAVSAANGLVRGAQLQAQMIAMGGDHAEPARPRPAARPGGARCRAASAPQAEGEDVLDAVNNGVDRAWDHWRRVGARLVATGVPRAAPRPADPLEALKHDL